MLDFKGMFSKTKPEVKKRPKTRILQNQVKCLKCGDKPFSAHRHDFKYCECGSIAVDGGMDYLKRSGNLKESIELSVAIKEDTYQEMVKTLQWCEDTERNHLGVICAIFRVLRYNGYDVTVPEDK